MDNDDAIVGRIFSRREALTLAGRGGIGLALGGALFGGAEAAMQAKAARDVRLVAAPALTEGPFFVDEGLERSNLIGDTTRRTVVAGSPLTLAVTIYKLAGGKYTPLPGVTVDVWHADAAGVYSDEDAPMNHERTGGQNWLRGYQTTDKSGLVRFETIFPGWYEGRATHIHFKVRQKSGAATKEFTSQLFFDDALAERVFAAAPYKAGTGRTLNARDGIFNERQVGGGVAGDVLTLAPVAAPNGKGHVAEFAIALTDDSLTSARKRGGPGGPGGPPPGGRPPGGPGGPGERNGNPPNIGSR